MSRGFCVILAKCHFLQVIVKTTTEYELQKKQKKKLYLPGIKKLNINLYDEMSEKVKVSYSALC